MRERCEELKRMKLNLGIYLALLAQGNLLRPYRYNEFRQLTMEIYADNFQFGVDPKEIQTFVKQDRFLAFSFSRDFVNPGGYKGLLDQWVMYTMLHERLMWKKISVKPADPEKNVFLLTQVAFLTISHRSIAILYPHMLNDFDFMDNVIGKQLVYEIRHVATFDRNNQIVALHLEHGLTQGWTNLLKNSKMVAQVMKKALVNSSSCYIEATVEEVVEKTR